MKRIWRMLVCVCLVCVCLAATLLALSSCAATPVSRYNKAVEKTMEEESYRESIRMSATATLDYVTVGVSIYSNLDCTGNTGSTFKASGEGAAVVTSPGTEDQVTPYELYIRDNYYYYHYANYFDDGSDYQYKFSAEYGSDEPISDLLSLTVVDVESAAVKEVDGKTVIEMTVKNDKIEDLMALVVEPMDIMLFGNTGIVDITLRDLTVTTTLDENGRVVQSTATVNGSGSFSGSYVSIVYVYDVTYTDFGAEITHVFPDEIESYPDVDSIE